MGQDSKRIGTEQELSGILCCSYGDLSFFVAFEIAKRCLSWKYCVFFNSERWRETTGASKTMTDT
jgi:hypothetical protein